MKGVDIHAIKSSWVNRNLDLSCDLGPPLWRIAWSVKKRIAQMNLL